MGKNFINKLLPLALTAAMIVPSVPAMAAPSDIAGHWAESVITQWQNKGLIQGYEDGTFKPGNTITRAEAAVMIANAARLSANEAGAYRFTDIGSIPAWARGSVGAVVAAGYMTGYPDGSFDANASISRAEAVSSLNRMLGGTAYQPTQPTTPTTDTTKTTSDDVVIENKGTTLKNQTVDGNVTIAKSVGNGDVTLRNVTIKGDLIVKGGGSNTVTLEDVDVRGKVRLLKEGVHLHLVGDTDIRKLLIDLAARITQSSSYKDEIDEIILAGDGDLNKTTRIDVPAKQLRIENQADLILGGDVEKLIVDEDAKGAEIEIKKGTTVNELNTDAKIKLTGKGRIDLLDVSASGVTFDKNLNIRKTDTSNGATAPKENGSTSTGGNSGGSSGGSSGTASKEITGAEKVTRDVPYGTSADDALAAIPKTVTLKLKGGSTTTTTVTNWKWADGVSYNTTPTENTNYKATTTVTIPSGYTYNGTLTAEATVTVHPLDKTKLEAAKNAYMDLQNKQTYDEKEAATDKEKILIKDSTPDQITAGVRFATPKDWRPLDDAIKSVENQERIGFASQQKCDDTAKTLQAAIDDFIQNKVKVGTSKTTDAYILQQVKNELLNPDKGDYAYSSHMQPLKPGYAYWLYNGYYSVPNSSVGVSIEWSVSGSDKVTIGNTDESDKDSNGYHYGYGAKIADGTTTPTPVTFTAKVKNSQNDHVIGTLDYPAIIGAPISATLQSGAPQFTTTRVSTSTTGATKFTGVVPITLKGAVAIASVLDGCVTMDGSNTNVNDNEVRLNSIRVDQVEKSGDVLNVTVTVTTGNIGGVWNENSSVPKFSEGILSNIAIDTSNFQLKENTLGWYLPPDTLKLGDMAVKVLTPAFTGVDLANDPTGPTFTIQTQNMPENATVEVALAKKDVGAGGIDNATIKKDATRGDDGKYSVTFDKSEFESGAEYYLWFRYGSPGSDWAYESVTNRPIYTFNNTTGGNTGSESEGSQAGA